MRLLQNKENVEAPDSDYPYGRIRDKAPSIPGSKVNEESLGDMHQFFEKLIAESGVTANELPENAYSGFQLIEALQKFGSNHFSKDLLLSLINTYTTNDVVILHGCEITANIPGTSSITAGAIYYNGVIYKVDATSISTPSNTIVFVIDSSEQPLKATIQNGASGSGIADYEDIKTHKCHIYLDNTSFANYFTITPNSNISTVTITRAQIIKTFDRIRLQCFGQFTGASATLKRFSINTTINDDFKMLNSGGSDVDGIYRSVGNNGFASEVIIGNAVSTHTGVVLADSFTAAQQLCVEMYYGTSVTDASFYFECEYIGANAYYRPYQF